MAVFLSVLVLYVSGMILQSLKANLVLTPSGNYYAESGQDFLASICLPSNSQPRFTLEYVSISGLNTLYIIKESQRGQQTSGGTCEGSLFSYSFVTEYIDHPSLVGQSAKLKVTTESPSFSAISSGVIIFRAGYSLTGSSEFAVLKTNYTWTCETYGLIPAGVSIMYICWYRGGYQSAQRVGCSAFLNGTCLTQHNDDRYYFDCSGDKYLLTIPDIDESEQKSTWRCVNNFRSITTSPNYTSSFMELYITGTRFLDVFHFVHTVSCTTYSWDVNAGGIIIIDSIQNSRSLCSKSVFGITITTSYTNRINCSFQSLTNKTTVEFCFNNISHGDSGDYVMTTGGQQKNGTIYVMDKPTKPVISPTSADEGSAVNIVCSSTSTSSPMGRIFTYLWTNNGTRINSSRFLVSGDKISIANVTAEDNNIVFGCISHEQNGLSSDETRITFRVILKGSPKLVTTKTTVLSGRSITFTCTFMNKPGFLGMAFRSSIGNACGLLSLRNGSCQATTGLCTGNKYECSADDLIYNFTIVNIGAIFNSSTFYCEESLTQIRSNIIQLTVLSFNEIAITSISVWPSNEVNETTQTTLTCEVNSTSYDKLTWIRHRNTSKEILRVDRATLKIDLDMLVQCADSGDYSCEITSNIGTMLAETISIKVYCKPRFPDCLKRHDRIFVEPGGLLNITSTIISNPQPSIIFLREIDSIYNTSLAPAMTITNTDIYSIISFVVMKATSDYTGTYYLLASNYLGTTSCLITLEMTDSADSKNTDSNQEYVMIIVGVIVPVLVIVALVVTITLWIRRKRQEAQPTENETSEYNNLNLHNVGGDEHKYSTVQSADGNGIQRKSEYNSLNLHNVGGDEHRYSTVQSADRHGEDERGEDDRQYLEIRNIYPRNDDYGYSTPTTSTESRLPQSAEDRPNSYLDMTGESGIPDKRNSTLQSAGEITQSATYANTVLDD